MIFCSILSIVDQNSSDNRVNTELKSSINQKPIFVKGSFTILHKVEMKYLIIPSDCVFSTLGNTLSKKHTKMFCEMVDKMVMLNKNGQGLF